MLTKGDKSVYYLHMKKISFVLALGLLILPVTSHAMTLADVMTQYYVEKASPKVLGASTTDGGQTAIMQKPILSADAKITILKGLRYSEGSANIVSKKVMKGMDKSDEVKKLQLFLISKGYLEADPTGKYGSMTARALKKFQMEKGIKGDGTFVGPATRAAIASEVAAATPDIKQ